MNTIGLNTEYLRHFVNDGELAGIHEEVLRAKRTLLTGSGRGNDFLGWVDLPETLSLEIVQSIKADVERLRTQARLFVVIGIGGSYLGGSMPDVHASVYPFNNYRTPSGVTK